MKAIASILKAQIRLILLGLIIIIFCYQFLDRPVVFLAEEYLKQYSWLKFCTYLTWPIEIFTFLAFLLLLIRFHWQKHNFHDQAALAAVLSVVIVLFLKDVLKFIFGRSWPATWINDNLSLLRDNVYGFNWLESSASYQSFPSGHLAITVAFMTSLAISYPRLKYLSFLIIALMAIGQLGLNYHFLSDVIAGGLLGYIVALNVNLKIQSIKSGIQIH
jgi:membrane-associated phospholipid phosphatase